MSRRHSWRCSHCWARSGNFRRLREASHAWWLHQLWFHPEKYRSLRNKRP